MSSLCVLITTYFPYGKGETFLENELPYLANAFDDVIILASSAGSNDLMRGIPGNVKCYPLNNISSRLRYLVYTIKGFFSMSADEKKEEKTVSWKKKAVCLYSSGRESTTYHKAKKILENEVDWTRISNVVFYSYWLVDTAMVVARLCETFGTMVGKAKAVSRGHGYDLYEERNSMRYIPYRKILLNKLDLVAPCSDDGNNYLRKKYPDAINHIVTCRIGTIDHGVCKVKKGDDIIRIVTCSNVIPVKRVDLIAKAFVLIAKQGKKIHWTCFGDGSEMGNVKRIVNSSNIGSMVELKGRVSNSMIYDYYSKNYVDVFVNSSISEGIPVSIMEALSFGIPCVATDVGGTSELVGEDEGALVPADIDDVHLAEAILAVYERVVNGEDLRNKARAKWELVASEKNYESWCRLLLD